jgi:hypothetical protein
MKERKDVSDRLLLLSLHEFLGMTLLTQGAELE